MSKNSHTSAELEAINKRIDAVYRLREVRKLAKQLLIENWRMYSADENRSLIEACYRSADLAIDIFNAKHEAAKKKL